MLGAQTQSQKDEIARKQKEMDVKKARYDKAKAIVDIVQNTAVAVAKVLGQFGLPYGAIAAALVGALGAVQVARVLAQPVPQYKMGRKDGPSEFAIVGEAGTERIEDTDGNHEYVSKPTIKYLPEHAKVIPSFELSKERLNKAALSSVFVTPGGQMIDKSQPSNTEVVKAVKEATRAIKNNKTTFHINRSWKGDSVSMERNFSYQKWIQDNI